MYDFFERVLEKDLFQLVTQRHVGSEEVEQFCVWVQITHQKSCCHLAFVSFMLKINILVYDCIKFSFASDEVTNEEFEKRFDSLL